MYHLLEFFIMKSFDNMLNQLKDSSGEMKENMHMLNEIVPVEEQMKYFEYSKSIQKNKERPRSDQDKNFFIAKLFTPDINIEDKRYYLVMLAGIIDVTAYRAIETYHSSPLEPELSYWSAMALAESKILLDTEFSEEKQYFVSTGLGGKNKKFRYFMVFATGDRTEFTEFQKENLIREIQFQFKKKDIEIEKFEFKSNYLKALILCGLNHNAPECLENIVKEINQFGPHLDKNFLLTNVRQIEDVEIEKLLASRSQ